MPLARLSDAAGCLWLGLAACAFDGHDAVEPASTAPAGDSAWETPDSGAAETGVAAPEPDRELSADDVTALFEGTFADGLPDARRIHTQYAEMMAAGDDVCPASDTEILSVNVGRNGCTAESGFHYVGLSHWYAGDDYFELTGLSPETTSADSFSLNGDFTITDPDELPFHFGGATSYQYKQSAPDSVQFTSQLAGTFTYTDAGGWMADRYSSDMSLSGGEEDGIAWMTVDGGVTMLGATFFFDDVTMGGEDCQTGFTGVLWVRDTSGAWFELAFGETCTACANLVFDGGREDMGEVCLSSAGVFGVSHDNLSNPGLSQ